MKRILPLALLMCVLLAGAAWSIGWFTQARVVRANLEASMAGLDPALGSMKAASITTSGFPGKLRVTVANPTISLHLKPLLGQMHKRMMAAAGNSAGVLTAPEYNEGTLSYTLAGNIIFTVNALADTLHMDISGNDTLQLVQPSGSFGVATNYNGNRLCQIRLERDFRSLTKQMWDMQKFFDDATFWKELRAIRCDLPGSISTDQATQQVTSSLAPSFFALTRTLDNAYNNATLQVQVKEYEVMPAGDAMITQLKRALTPANEPYIPFAMSLYGKQSVVFDGAFGWSDVSQNMGDYPVKFDIKQFYITNAAGTSNGALLFATQPQGSQMQGQLVLTLTSDFTPKQTELAKVGVSQFVTELQKSPQWLAMEQKPSLPAVEAAIFDALPNITAMGTLTEKIRLEFAGDKTKAEGNFNLSVLELSSRDYGLTGNAVGSLVSGQPSPAINANLTCRNCLPLVGTLGNYLARVIRAAAIISPQNPMQMQITPADVEGAQNLVAALGVQVTGQPADLQFAIKNEATGISINGKAMPEVMMLMQQYMGGSTPPAAPAP